MNEISVVTAFFNINRDDWSGFGRSAERYFSYFTSWARLRNRIIVYVETEELKAKIMAFRTGLGLAEQTFVNIVPRCSDIDPELFETLRQATENPVQQIFRLSQRCPEVWNAQYNYIMLLKTWCVQDAVSRGQAEGHVAWVDFGYAHIEPAAAESYFNFNFTWRFNFPHKVNIFRVTELDDRPLFDIVMTMDTYIAGGCMVAPGDLWAEFWQRLRQSALTMAACGLADDDQNVVLLTYRRYPDLFAVHPSGFFSQIQQYNDTGTEWSEKSSSSPMHKRLLDKLRAKLRRIRFAFRVYRYINRL